MLVILIMSFVLVNDLPEPIPVNLKTTIKKKIRGDKIQYKNKLLDGTVLIAKMTTNRNIAARINTIKRYERKMQALKS